MEALSGWTFFGGAFACCAAFAQGYYFGYRVTHAEEKEHALHIEAGYLKLLGARMGQIRAAQKGIERLRKRNARLQWLMHRWVTEVGGASEKLEHQTMSAIGIHAQSKSSAPTSVDSQQKPEP